MNPTTEIARAQRHLDDAESTYEMVRDFYVSGIRRDDELLASARARVVDAEAALVALARCF